MEQLSDPSAKRPDRLPCSGMNDEGEAAAGKVW